LIKAFSRSGDTPDNSTTINKRSACQSALRFLHDIFDVLCLRIFNSLMFLKTSNIFG
jgi:hypothetical protein